VDKLHNDRTLLYTIVYNRVLSLCSYNEFDVAYCVVGRQENWLNLGIFMSRLFYGAL